MHFNHVRMCVSLLWGFVMILYALMGFSQIFLLYDLKYTWHFIFLILNNIAMSYLDLGMPRGSFQLRYNKIYPYYWSRIRLLSILFITSACFLHRTSWLNAHGWTHLDFNQKHFNEIKFVFITKVFRPAEQPPFVSLNSNFASIAHSPLLFVLH